MYAYFRNDVSTSAHVDNTRSTENAYTKPAAYTTLCFQKKFTPRTFMIIV